MNDKLIVVWKIVLYIIIRNREIKEIREVIKLDFEE